MTAMAKPFLWCSALFFAVAGAAAWLIPVEAAQQWFLPSGPADPFAAFESLGRTEALCWLARAALPIVALALAYCALLAPQTAAFARAAGQEFLFATACGSRGTSLLVRLFVVGWMLIAAAHVARAVSERGRDWAYFHRNSGSDVLPNISFENRDVIRYVEHAVPPGSRILVASDQKLFFLSYYLLPRRLFHVMHPDAEFVIPLANQERPLAAYRLEDLTAEQIDRGRPDYILEYFQDPRLFNRERVTEDRDWTAYWQAAHETREAPPYLVVLRRAGGEGAL